MTYAGRLDPMASGVLLILAGDEVKNKEKYLKLDKEYEFEVLFGFATDTFDILGKILKKENIVRQGLTIGLKKEILKNLRFFIGDIIQKYPIFSSKTVKGKPLFEYGREGVSVMLPENKVKVKSLKFLGLKSVGTKKLLENIERRIKKVKGDFRQKEILNIWNKELSKNKDKYFIANFKIRCSSGTYVRSIANDLGKNINLPALAFKIKRTRIYI